MNQKLVPATESPAYRKFIAERDRALEVVLRKGHVMASDAARKTFKHILDMIYVDYSRMAHGGFFGAQSHTVLDRIRDEIRHALEDLNGEMWQIANMVRRTSYVLAKVGEAEAIARTTGKPAKAEVSHSDAAAIWDAPFLGHPLWAHTLLVMHRLARTLTDEVERSRVHELSTEDMIKNVEKKLPVTKRYKKPPRVLRPLREAETGPGTALAFGDEGADRLLGNIDDQMWDEAVAFYRNEFVPKHRGPSSVVDIDVGDADLEETYGWEIENILTHDFVQRVRDGQVEAAKQNGIKDFVWISVIDSHTDECCVWRNGLTTTEIRDKLKKNPDDRCPSEVPPAHMNCRCTLAPMLPGMEDAPERPQYEDFESWLQTG